MTNIKEVAAKLRSDMKAAGIRGRVRIQKDMARREVVEVGNMEMFDFSQEEILGFCTVAKNIGFTLRNKIEIDPAKLSINTSKKWWNFYI